jgi:uncharacterized repeat protein (TIGR03803 family)
MLRFMKPGLAGLLAATSASAGTLTHLYSFTGGADGIQPAENMVADAKGNLYGTAYAGGMDCTAPGVSDTTGCGTVWKLDTSGKLTVLVTFDGTNGATPWHLAARDGVLYGSTLNGGSGGDGVIFKVGMNGRMFTVLHAFSGADGCTPGEPQFDAAGDLFAKAACAANGNGAIVEITAAGTFQTVYTFPGSPATNVPYSVVVDGTNGLLYGSTNSSSCANTDVGCGTVFSLTPDGTTYKTLADLSKTTAGVLPYLEFVKGGKLFGSSFYGGSNGNGAFFTVTAGHGVVKTRYSPGPNDGAPPYPPVKGSAGTLYGTTFYGSANTGPASGQGTIYSLTSAGTYQTLYAFSATGDANINGTYPNEQPVWVNSTSALYGSTWFGGVSGAGGASIDCVRPDGTVANIYGCGTIWRYKP